MIEYIDQNKQLYLPEVIERYKQSLTEDMQYEEMLKEHMEQKELVKTLKVKEAEIKQDVKEIK